MTFRSIVSLSLQFSFPVEQLVTPQLNCRRWPRYWITHGCTPSCMCPYRPALIMSSWIWNESTTWRTLCTSSTFSKRGRLISFTSVNLFSLVGEDNATDSLRVYDQLDWITSLVTCCDLWSHPDRLIWSCDTLYLFVPEKMTPHFMIFVFSCFFGGVC